MTFVAVEVREYMAALGFRTVDEMVGRSERLEMRRAIDHWKAHNLDFSRILYRPPVPKTVGRTCQIVQEHKIEESLDATTLIPLCAPALERGEKVRAELEVHNTNRVVGTSLGSEVTRRYGGEGLPEDTIELHFRGSAGQSFGAFIPRGLTLTLEGDANDYLGKGLSGGKLILFPPREATFVAEENVITGNVALYGATSGEAYIRGIAGERFCVRNSGATAVVEGVGDHGCEYMTGGRVVIIGKTGRNFAAGMSGGIAYVLDESGEGGAAGRRLRTRLQQGDGPALPALGQGRDRATIRRLLERHHEYTASPRAKALLDDWDTTVSRFIRVVPNDYRRVLEAQARMREQGTLAGGGRDGRLRGERPGRAPRGGELTMGKTTGFMEFEREKAHVRPPLERIKDWNEAHPPYEEETLRQQGARCMDCGIPYCHAGALVNGLALGCPINNLIPEWNDLVYRGQWREAIIRLHKTNNFPEFTGRVCPAPCEGSCTVGISGQPVTIKTIEAEIIDRAFREGWIVPEPPLARTGFKVAVVGSGPAGLSAAAQLNRAGHVVTVFERDDRIGGLLMYGIPNMKLDKSVVERRVKLMEAEGDRVPDRRQRRSGRRAGQARRRLRRRRPGGGLHRAARPAPSPDASSPASISRWSS